MLSVADIYASRRPHAPTTILAGFTGFAAGCGALLAVFVLLPLPPKLAGPNADLGVGIGRTYCVVALLELAAALIVFFGFKVKQKATDKALSANVFREEFSRLVKGFRLAKDPELLLSYLSALYVLPRCLFDMVDAELMLQSFTGSNSRRRLVHSSFSQQLVRQNGPMQVG